MIVHTLEMCTAFLCTFDKYVLIFEGSWSYAFSQTLHNDSSHIKDVHRLFCAHLIILHYICESVELRHYNVYTNYVVLTLCNLLLQQFSIILIQTWHTYFFLTYWGCVPCILGNFDLFFVFIFGCWTWTFLRPGHKELKHFSYIGNTYRVPALCNL